ncbi:Hypothetical predicted protein [Paramuricea clavata]|uniref:Uncharacterized protein n=1 Tax=Paramuricea clavata TaxID=317549 RepID=A0A7D9J273_PARCT|nr:Hypothetical predicted protein [Paramuricea clavata]
MVTPTASIVQSNSVTVTSSPVATPSLRSTVISSSPGVHSSSIVPYITSSAAPLITPSPTAVVFPETIQINDTDGKPCLYVKLEVDFVIHYNATIKNVTSLNTTKIPLNGFDNSTGACSYSEGRANFLITWNEDGNVKPQHAFQMKFQSAHGRWNVSEVNVLFQTIGDRNFQHATEPIAVRTITYLRQ